MTPFNNEYEPGDLIEEDDEDDDSDDNASKCSLTASDVVDDDDEEEDDDEVVLQREPEIPPGKRRSNNDNKIRGRIIKLCWKLQRLTGTTSALMFVTLTNRVIQHASIGSFHTFVRLVADSVLEVGYNMVKLIHRYNGANLGWSFTKLKAVAEDVGVDKKLADEADRLYRLEVMHGRWAIAHDSIRDIISEMFQHICSRLQDSPSASVEEEPGHTSENEDSTEPSTPTSSINNVISGATVNNVSSSTKLIDAVRSQLQSGDLDTFPKFETFFKTWLQRDINNFESWPVTIEQDYVDPVSGLTSKSLAWLEARNGRITGSNSYELLGEGFGSVENAVKDFVFGNNYESKSNFAKGLMLWGTYCEDTARNVLEHQLRHKFPNDQISIKQAG